MFRNCRRFQLYATFLSLLLCLNLEGVQQLDTKEQIQSPPQIQPQATSKVEAAPVPQKGETPAEENLSGKIYVTSWFANVVSIIDARNLHISAVANVGVQDSSVRLTPDEKFAWVANNGSSTISVIDTTSDKAIKVFYPGGNGPSDIYFSADGKEAYVTCEFDDTLALIDPTTFTTIATIDTGNMPRFVTGTQDKLFVSNFGDGTVTVINKATRQPITTLTVGYGPMGLSATKDGKWVVVACHNANQVALIDVENLQVTARISTQPGPAQVAVHPNQEYAIVTTDGIGSVQKIDLKTNQIVKTIAIAEDAGTQGATFTSKGLLLVTNAGSSSVTIVDSDSGEIICSITVPFGPKGIAFKNL